MPLGQKTGAGLCAVAVHNVAVNPCGLCGATECVGVFIHSCVNQLDPPVPFFEKTWFYLFTEPCLFLINFQEN